MSSVESRAMELGDIGKDECGRTVADARRLAEQAVRVFIHYHVGPEDWRTGSLMLSTEIFLTTIQGRDAERMPSRLYRAGDGKFRLQIG